MSIEPPKYNNVMLVWKLLRQHISVPQFVGFFFANLCGMLIVMLGYQFYSDVVPVFTAEDSFMKADYIIMSKKVGAADLMGSRENTFSNADVDDIARQQFATSVGVFTSTEYKVDARMSVNGVSVLNSELFFESVPDEFVDVPLNSWKYKPGDNTIPIILPRSYMAMYNFGFAQSRSLPKLSEGLVAMIDFTLFLKGNGHEDCLRGRVIGFSSRLNTILVPQSFMEWSNEKYAPGQHSEPTRVVMKVANPADENIAKYIGRKGYDVDADKLDAEKTTYFLRMMVTMVMAVGIVISVLSFYILMLSIFLLVQKNSTKLQNLLLIGYSPARVARPYQLLSIWLNLGVLVMALALLFVVRTYYMDILIALFPDIADGSLLPGLACGLLLTLVVTVFNILAIRQKIVRLAS
ncbi:MAG: ABC transporter permease [Prevotella sp.]|nr:ABC transporter permease [Prevotella sp.]